MDRKTLMDEVAKAAVNRRIELSALFRIISIAYILDLNYYL